MKDALERENLRPFLMIQALGFHVPEAQNLKAGYHELPEYPFCKLTHYLSNNFDPIYLLFKNVSIVGEFKVTGGPCVFFFYIKLINSYSLLPEPVL